jgi:hypothetical protein
MHVLGRPLVTLPEDRRQIDRDHVQAFPKILATIGLRIVRTPSYRRRL